ncbi:MAG: hypothetical protein COV60_02705 [Candidatus Magasanikbacteria bacterium CG11_big_fil_rev_8_21_14_0_20_43_7]|uniref:SIMPL domain-containing protein n=1 Tax=Candidatus Magasanikbacteria bacterium CG11_big_fil_rev_8_21_14_0_20_43_7 TaxID=1974654 RepID=A0A2H0N287_9BACT|nr:MAG: hypothetical protein COV60_02705 [Candidatus Magasanikbacteria bacterium CG11_big_fil_rev_8_21_14_0_20_43_7]
MPVSKKPQPNDMRSFFHGGEFVHRIFITLFGILLVYAIFWMGTLIRNNIESYAHIGQADRQERMITIDAEAKVTATPDIAMTTIGMVATGTSVNEAQQANTTVMNTLISRLGELDIAEDDIQTAQYNIYPQYNYTSEEGRILEGYEVSQSVTIKIRDLTNANNVIALAGEVGANSVGGLQFTIDDRDVYRQEATTKALEKVYTKARSLSSSLGVKLISVVSYNEYEVGGGGYDMYKSYDAVGMGGTPAPDIQAGSTDVVMHTSVTFEIR